MLSSITLKNFKIFKEKTTFPLSKINLLTGTNGRGKSSLLQSLLLMRQSIEIDENTDKLYLNGNCVRLGKYDDVKNEQLGTDELICFEFGFSNQDEFIKYSFKKYEENKMLVDSTELRRCPSPDKIYSYLAKITQFSHSKNLAFKVIDSEGYEDKTDGIKKGNDYLMRNFHINNPIKPQVFEELPYFIDFDKIHYVSADRIGPKDFYLKENLKNFINVGAKGENTANVLSYKKKDNINEKLYLGKDANTLIQQTEEWLKYIFGEAKFNIDDNQREVIYLLFNTQPKTPIYKPSNVGFGFSYILPIIVSGLIAKEGEILIIENPEAHLHPKAQSQLTKFLAKVASIGVQVFVESHSEHILNGLRIAVIDKEIALKNTDVSVLYFHNNATKNRENQYFTQIPISEKGKITTWLDGFFDQSENDLDIILGTK